MTGQGGFPQFQQRPNLLLAREGIDSAVKIQNGNSPLFSLNILVEEV